MRCRRTAGLSLNVAAKDLIEDRTAESFAEPVKAQQDFDAAEASFMRREREARKRHVGITPRPAALARSLALAARQHGRAAQSPPPCPACLTIRCPSSRRY